MTNKEWGQVQEALKSQYHFVKLQIDGYEASLSLVRISTYKLAICIYINDVFKGEWLIKDCEERRRFLQKKQRSLLTSKEKGTLKKLSQKKQKELTEKYKYNVYSSVWTSFPALKKHLIANNETIELIEIT